MNAKAWWKSRTLIFNALAAAAAVAPQLASLPVLTDDYYYAGLSGAIVLGNVALRLVTTTAVARRDGEPWP